MTFQNVLTGFSEGTKQTQSAPLTQEDKLNLICSVVLSFRDFSADVVYVLDSPRSSSISDVNHYFDVLETSLKPNVAHLSDIHFLLDCVGAAMSDCLISAFKPWKHNFLISEVLSTISFILFDSRRI